MNAEFAVWNMLHDGCIVAVEGTVPGEVTVSVEIQCLRSMLPDPGDCFLVRLSGCSLFEFRRFFAGQTPASDLTAVVAEEPEILSAQSEDRAVVISMTHGAGPYMELHLQYKSLSIYLENGRPVPIEELAAAARRYGDELGNQ